MQKILATVFALLLVTGCGVTTQNYKFRDFSFDYPQSLVFAETIVDSPNNLLLTSPDYEGGYTFMIAILSANSPDKNIVKTNGKWSFPDGDSPGALKSQEKTIFGDSPGVLKSQGETTFGGKSVYRVVVEGKVNEYSEIHTVTSIGLEDPNGKVVELWVLSLKSTHQSAVETLEEIVRSLDWE